MAFVRRARSRSGFKRRSAMKMLHHVTIPTGAVAVPNAGVPGTILSYVNVARHLSTKFGRNLSQSSTFRLVGFRVSLGNFADSFLDIGGSVLVQLRTVTPTRGRVNAHEAIMREYVADVRDDSEQSRGRQLFVGYDAVQPPDAAESVLMRNDVPNRVHLLGASGAGNIGMFADHNARFPIAQGVGGLNQPDQDLYTEYASQSEDTLQGHATLYSAHPQDVEDISGVVTSFGPWNHAIQVADFEWWAPAGTYIPMMCGLGKIIMADSNWPVIQTGASTTLGDNVDQRGALTALIDLWIEGWTPISKK